ncbi:MAG: hypothetical protein AAEJ57_02480, partial [Opitutales bacterium]
LGLDHEAVARTSELRNRILAEKAAAAEAASQPEGNDPESEGNEKDSGADSPDNNASTGATADRILNELRENNDANEPTPPDPLEEEEGNPRP